MPNPDDSPLHAEQSRRNQSTRTAWQLFAEHRQHVMRLLAALPRVPQGRLCLLGAGNANDVDLDQLGQVFDEIHLVDLDEAALASARQGLAEATQRRIHCHAPVDLSGILPTLEYCLRTGPAHAAPIGPLLAASSTSAWPDRPAAFDTVVSCCLISQLIDEVAQALGSDHPQLLEVILEVRRRHLWLLAELLSPGGQGLLVTDFVASTTLPDLMDFPAASLAGLMRQLVETRNFFTGLNPLAIRQQFATDDGLKSRCDGVRMASPWRWNIGPKQFLVTAIAFHRRPLSL